MHDINRPYYFVIDRMYNVRAILDRAGAIVERYAYDSYGRPLIRESCGRGDMNQDTRMSSTDTTRFNAAKASSIWDPRADMDDDGDVDSNDETLYTAKYSDWSGSMPDAEPRQAFSDLGNPFMFQGVPHFALDTEDDALIDVLSLNHHRARLVDCPTGRWNTRDPLLYKAQIESQVLTPSQSSLRTGLRQKKTSELSPTFLAYVFVNNSPCSTTDPSGLLGHCDSVCEDNSDAFALGILAFTTCCTDSVMYAPICLVKSCFKPGLDITTCPGACTDQHEEVRRNGMRCGFRNCNCAITWSREERIANDCVAYTASWACFSYGLCQGTDPSKEEFYNCMSHQICNNALSEFDAARVCGPPLP